MNRLEQTLQQEIALRLAWEKWPVVMIPVPNGIFIPARTPAERSVVARIVARMKNDGMLLPGACDFVLLWAAGAACVECKRPATPTLFGKLPAGRSSREQREFAAECASKGVTYVMVQTWGQLAEFLRAMGVSAANAS